MLLKNTSQYNTTLVKFIIKHAAHRINIENVAINVKNSSYEYAGRAFPSVPRESPWRGQARYLVVCRVGSPEKFPYQCKGYPGRVIETGRWPTPLFADWMECMVMLVAHELFHIEQFRAKAVCSEQETEAYAMRRLTAWRDEVVATGKVPSLPTLQQSVVVPQKSKNETLTIKLEHCRAMLDKNATKFKRSETLVKKWRTKVRYYEKKIVDTSIDKEV